MDLLREIDPLNALYMIFNSSVAFTEIHRNNNGKAALDSGCMLLKGSSDGWICCQQGCIPIGPKAAIADRKKVVNGSLFF